MYTFHYRDAEVLRLKGRDVRVLVGHDTLTSDRMTFGVTEVPVKTSMDPHVHSEEEEIIYVLQGYGQVYADNVVELLEPGTAIKVSPGSSHYIINRSDEVMRFVFCFSPPARVGSYEDRSNS